MTAGLFEGIQDHNLANMGLVHTDWQASRCVCQQSPTHHPSERLAVGQAIRAVGADGGVCFSCGGMTIRTGTCTECTNCFTSSGGCG